MKTCPLHKFRLGKGKIILKDLRAKCKDCDGGGFASIKSCVFDGVRAEFCPLWPYRLGKNPKRRGQGTKRATLTRSEPRQLTFSANKGILARGNK